MKNIASCSFGKDSLASIILAEKHGIHVDGAVYCRIMFNDEISAEFPQHEEFIYGTAIPLLESRYGIKTKIVQANVSYCDVFYRIFTRGKFVGRIYGFPMRCGSWCNSELKVTPINSWKREIGDFTSIVGIACDELKRINRKTEKNNILPLVDYGITESEAFSICKNEGLLSPAYDTGRSRLGCWFCHNQRISELKYLRKNYPNLWDELILLDELSPVTFRPGITLHQLENRFYWEDQQFTIFDYGVC